MSVTTTSWVWEHSDAIGNARLVMLVLADEANDDGTACFPGHQRIAEKARIARGTVRAALSSLETDGEILAWTPDVKGRGRFAKYVVLMGRDRGEFYFDGNDWCHTPGVRPPATLRDQERVNQPVDNSRERVKERVNNGSNPGRNGSGKGQAQRSDQRKRLIPIPVDPDNPAAMSQEAARLQRERNAARERGDVCSTCKGDGFHFGEDDTELAAIFCDDCEGRGVA